jgi:hypothetical protein
MAKVCHGQWCRCEALKEYEIINQKKGFEGGKREKDKIGERDKKTKHNNSHELILKGNIS